MPTLKLRFPGGRYHATPWGHHVNEGLIEWPPSPWRLLRALIACGFSSQGWAQIPPVAEQLINKLSGVLPSYQLPKASAAHTRHFMPVGVLAKGREQTTLVFDTWANVGDGELRVNWPCELSDEEAALLGQVADALGYLGRSESWVEAALVVGAEQEPVAFNAFPHLEGAHPGREYEQISLMAALPALEYRKWQQETTAPILEVIKLPDGPRKPTAKQLQKFESQRAQAISPYPPDLLSCLTKDTAWWKQHGWSQPPGSRRVLYWRRNDSLEVGVPQRPRPQRPKPLTTILLSLTTPSGSRSALPPCARTVPQAELFHRVVVAKAAKGGRVFCPELTGTDQHNRPLQDHHSHAHMIPVDLDSDGRLDHLVIHASMGLGDTAQRAIRESRETWRKNGPDLQVAIVGHGDLEILRQLPAPLERSAEKILGPIGGSKVWISITPFVPPRFLKSRGKNTLVGQINAELASRRLPEVESAAVDPELTRKLRHFVRRRNHGGKAPPVDAGYGLRLIFREPINGPLVIGYASHFGLGLFYADSD
ncbi:MAG: type I-U CRISPR-associated protein Cas5/Cas6 [Planctomycetes bacterium]|nr:type I-U CRISPR-associated protein Cas5/Cas6 [Planctomycetota bacterium]